MRPQSLRSLFSITAAICISFVFADNNFNIVGDGLVSAQMIFLLDENTLMILDKTECALLILSNYVAKGKPESVIFLKKKQSSGYRRSSSLGISIRSSDKQRSSYGHSHKYVLCGWQRACKRIMDQCRR